MSKKLATISGNEEREHPLEIEIFGRSMPVERLRTGLFSLDMAVANMRTAEFGYPLRTVTELYGKQHCGKSTLAYYLAGLLRPEEGIIRIADLEGSVDPDYLPLAIANGFTGKVEIIEDVDEKGKPKYHSEVLDTLLERMLDENTTVGIMDSVSSYIPIAEESGTIGEANMGRRAKEIAQFARKGINRLTRAEDGRLIFVINHPYQILGSHGHTTAGGQVLKFVAGTSIMMRRVESNIIKSRQEDHFISQGEIKKNRFGGGVGRKFKAFFLEGRGLHPGLTALVDCVDLGLAHRGSYVKIGEDTVGRLSVLIDNALDGKDEVFDPFFEQLEGYEESLVNALKGGVDED